MRQWHSIAHRVVLAAACVAAFVVTPAAGRAQSGKAAAPPRALTVSAASQGFEPGDRIVLEVAGDSALTDTFTVRANRVVLLPQLPPLSLDGVRRIDAQQHVQQFLQQYLRNVSVRVTPLVRVGILGAVKNPGYYAVAADLPLSDAVMAAGGFADHADADKIVVRRNDRDWLKRKDVDRAMRDGTTVDQLGLHSGDEIAVGEKPQISWETALSTLGVLGGVILALRR